MYDTYHAGCKVGYRTIRSIQLITAVIYLHARTHFIERVQPRQPPPTPPPFYYQYSETADGIRESYKDVPCKVVDCSKSDLETFAEICDFVEEVAAKREDGLGPEGMKALKEMVRVR